MGVMDAVLLNLLENEFTHRHEHFGQNLAKGAASARPATECSVEMHSLTCV